MIIRNTTMKWLNKPNRWKGDTKSLYLHADPGTDFWRVTHYGFIRDSGHFYYQGMAGDFMATVKVSGQYKELYHQAGLMIRLDERNWIKTGIEYVDDVQNISAVVTREFSDWSVVPCTGQPEAIWLRLLRKADYVQVAYSFDSVNYTMLRLAPFPPGVDVQIGMMAAAPGDEGFNVIFEDFSVGAING